MSRPKGRPRPVEDTRADEKVVVAYVHPGHVDGGFHTSLINLFVWDLQGPRRILDGGGHIAMQSGANITGARNDTVRMFLESHTADWLLWIDSDMVFTPDSLERLLRAADPKERPIMGGLCFGKWIGGPYDEIFPTIYWWDDSSGTPGVVRANEYPENAVWSVGATGSAFILIHRSVFEGMSFPEPYPFYQETALAGHPVSEDMTFCLRAVASGFPIFVHTGVKVGHVKPETIGEPEYRRYLARKQPPKVVVTGWGRSGTGYTSEVLNRVGVRCGHEEWWNPYNKRAPDLMADASWLALPDCHPETMDVFFQLRDPLKVLSSLMNGEMEEPWAVPYLAFKEAHTPGWDGDMLSNYVRFLVAWWELAIDLGCRMYRIEDFDAGTVQHIAACAGVDVTEKQVNAAIGSVPKTTNKHRPGPKLGWSDLPDIPETARLMELAEEYGYVR